MKRPPLIVVPHPAGPLGVISRRVAGFPPRTLECCHPAAGLGASQLSTSGDPETRCAAGPSFPGAVPRVLSFLVPRNQGPRDLDPGVQGKSRGGVAGKTVTPYLEMWKASFLVNNRLLRPLLKTPESPASLCLSRPSPACQSLAVYRGGVGNPVFTKRIKKKNRTF